MSVWWWVGAVGERVTVAKLQVGLLGSARTLQKQLDRIASRADTNTPSGLHYILQGACFIPETAFCAHVSPVLRTFASMFLLVLRSFARIICLCCAVARACLNVVQFARAWL